MNIPPLKDEPDEVVEAPKTEFVCKPDDDEPPNKLGVVVVAPNIEVFACEVIGLLNSEAEDALPSWLVVPNTLLLVFWPNTL